VETRQVLKFEIFLSIAELLLEYTKGSRGDITSLKVVARDATSHANTTRLQLPTQSNKSSYRKYTCEMKTMRDMPTQHAHSVSTRVEKDITRKRLGETPTLKTLERQSIQVHAHAAPPPTPTSQCQHLNKGDVCNDTI
jgi:hypothetical protein